MFQLINQKTQSPGDIAYWTLGFLFLLGMHYMQAHPAGDGLQVSFNTFSWIPFSIVIGAGLLQIVKTSQLVTSSLTKGLALAAAILLIPLAYPGSESLIDLGRFYAIFAGLLFFIVLQQLQLSDRRVVLLLFWVLAAVWVESFLGWIQLSASEPDLLLGLLPVGQRPIGVFRQPNVMASFLATGLVLSAYLIVRARSLSPGKALIPVVCLLTPLVVVPLLMVLNSRVGWLGSILGTLMVLPYVYSQAGKRICLAWIAMFFLGVALGVFVMSSIDGGWALAANKLQVDPARSFIYPQVIRMLLENPLFGVGYGNFEASYNLFAANLYAAGITENAGYPNLHHPHNELLFWGAEGGVIALGALLFAAWLVLKSILRMPKGHRLVLVGLLFPIVLHTQTEFPFYHSMIHWVVFVLLLYLVDRSANEQNSKELKSTLLFGTGGVVIPLATTAFMITTLHAGAILTRYEKVSGTGVDTLLKIVNPVIWQERIRWELGTSRMYVGLTEGDISGALSFISLVESSLEKKPRWQNYQDLIFAYEFIRDSENADRVMREAEYRYPTREFFRQGSDGSLVIIQYQEREEI